tara:strand:- start:17733 stop:20576 length:2844 start_codon:yes stop_codon:yes gene_type:complete
MTSKTVEEKIQHLEVQQWTLEKELRDHKHDIYDLRNELQSLTAKPEQLRESTAEQIKAIKKRAEEVSLLENLKTPEHLTEKTSKPSPPLPLSPTSEVKIKPTPKTTLKPKRDLRTMEQDFGKVWFVRLGIISLLTGLIFLSNFTYQNYITEWGAGPRLGGMYSLAALLLGLGTYFEKAKAALSNYGKVLAAGGIATLYYTSYAAHHIERLKVIDSALLGGVLLTASAAACLAYALWKRSNLTAICSIALAYYSTSINPVGAFSLVSGLILTLTGLVLLHKLRSASIGFVSMLGAYLSLIFWQILVNQGATTYEHTSWFIVGYWVLSTVSILLPRTAKDQPFSRTQMMTFASLNNAFLVILMSVDFQTQLWVEPLWPVSAVIGSVFIGLALFLQFGEKLTSSVSNISFRFDLRSLFLLKGTALITLALCLKLTGPSLAYSLTLQAGLLLIAACRAEGTQKISLTIASYLVLILGFFIYLEATSANLTDFTLTHIIMALLYLGLSVIAHFGVSPTDETKPLQRCIPALFSIIASCCCIISAQIPVFSQITLFLSLNLAFTLYQYLSNRKNILPEFCHAVHVFSAIACVMILEHFSLFSTAQFFLITLILFAATTINLCIFIKRGKPHTQYTAYLVAATISLLITLVSINNVTIALLIGSLIPFAYHAIYQKLIAHKLRFIAILGFTVYPFAWFASLVTYIDHFYDSHMFLHLVISLIPLVHLVLIKQKHLAHFKGISPMLTIATAAMVALWQITYIGHWELTLALTAGVYHLLDQKETRLLTTIAGVFYLYSIMHATLVARPMTHQLTIDLIALLPLAIYFCRKFMLTRISLTTSAYYLSTQRGIAVIASLALWIFSSQHLSRFYDGSALSIVWAVVGLIILSLGFINKDIVFRTMAFIILGCTVVHVYGVDVWKLNAILRIFSFITLGVVLLIIGYLYSRKVDQSDGE